MNIIYLMILLPKQLCSECLVEDNGLVGYNFCSTYDKGQPGTSGEMPRIVAGGDVTDAGDTVS